MSDYVLIRICAQCSTATANTSCCWTICADTLQKETQY